MCFTKGLFRIALIGGLATAGLVYFVGPDTLANGFQQVRNSVKDGVDKMIDDPIVLRRELQSLADEYPETIAEVRSELASVEQQIAQLSHDAQVAQRVVKNTSRDLTDLEELIAMAKAEQAQGARHVRVVFDNRKLDATDARHEFERVHSIRAQYQDRLLANERDLEYLRSQKSRLSEILSTLEQEQAALESEMWQLDRKIDAIARQERLADMMQEREEDFSRFNVESKANTLNQLRTKLASWEAEVDARIEALENKSSSRDYEDEARWDIEINKQRDEHDAAEIEFGEIDFDKNDETVINLDERENLALGSDKKD